MKLSCHKTKNKDLKLSGYGLFEIGAPEKRKRIEGAAPSYHLVAGITMKLACSKNTWENKRPPGSPDRVASVTREAAFIS